MRREFIPAVKTQRLLKLPAIDYLISVFMVASM